MEKNIGKNTSNIIIKYLQNKKRKNCLTFSSFNIKNGQEIVTLNY